MSMATNLRVPDPVYEAVGEVAEQKDISKKAAIARMLSEAGYDV